MAVATWHAHMHSHVLGEKGLFWPKPISLNDSHDTPTIKSGASLHFPCLPSHFSTSVVHFPVVSSHWHLNILQLGFLSLLPYFLTNLPFTFFCANFFHFFFLYLLNHKSSDSKITSCATQKISRPN